MASIMRSKWIAVVCLLFIAVLGVWVAMRKFKAPEPVITPAVEKAESPLPVVPPVAPSLPSPPRPAPLISVPVAAKTVPKAASKTVSVKKAPEAEPSPRLVPIPLPPPPVPREWGGNDTSVRRSGQVVVKNDRQWIQFWAEHHPHEAAPEVDFTRDMVVGVFSGTRPADQFAVEIVAVRTLADAVVVDYRERIPPPGTLAINVSVYPYALKVIPRSTLPVKFNVLSTQR